MLNSRSVRLRFVAIMLSILLILLVWSAIPIQAADSGPAREMEIELGDALAGVNGVLIAREHFDAAFARVASFSTAADLGTLAVDVLNSLIEAELILQFAAANAIEIGDDEVDAEVASLKENLGDDRWGAWLAENLYTEDEFWQTIHMQFISSAVRDQATARLQGEVEHVRARHILVARESEAQRVLERLSAGESFAALAALLSRDISTRDYGGDLGWFVRGELLDPSLGEAAFSQALAEIGGPIATRLGYHVLQVIGMAERRIEAGRLPHITENIFSLWLVAQVEAAEIRLNLEALDALAEPRQ